MDTKSYIEKITNLDTSTEIDWSQYFELRDTELETEYTNLVSGTATRTKRGFRKVGYTRLRDFYDGDQWTYIPEAGQSMKVYNYCRPTVLNYTAFMTNEPLDIDVPSLDINDEVEIARAEAKEKALKDILFENKFNILFEEAVLNGSLLGDSIVLGPFYDKENDRIWFQNVKKPENVRIIWEDDAYKEIFGYIHHYYISVEKAHQQYGVIAEKKDIKLMSDETKDQENSAYNQSARKMILVKDCWTADIRILKIGSKILEFSKHEWGFVPIVHVPNIPHPEEPFGTSDIEDLLDAQVEYNERNSDASEVVRQTAYPYVWGSNLRPVEVQGGQVNLIDIGDEAKIHPDPRGGRQGGLENEIARRRSDFFQLSGLNENIFGGAGVKAVTGRALAVLMQTVNNRIKGRQTRWTDALQKLFENIFILIEKFAPQGKELVAGYYKTDIFFPGTLLRNITDEINKFNAKLQSQETTMKNLGVPSPKDEKKLIRKEMQDKVIMAEISRNPQLQLQLMQQVEQMVQSQQGGQGPVLREDQNFEDQPSAQAGVPQQSAGSPEGAIRQSGQRAGASIGIDGGEGAE